MIWTANWYGTFLTFIFYSERCLALPCCSRIAFYFDDGKAITTTKKWLPEAAGGTVLFKTEDGHFRDVAMHDQSLR
jgi:hypothetical protein